MEDNFLIDLYNTNNDDLLSFGTLYTPELQEMPVPSGVNYSVYTVLPNDNLSKIARGDIGLTRAIAYENKLKDPNLIHVNELLLIPNNYDYTDNLDYNDYINNVYSPAINQFVAQRNARINQQNQLVLGLIAQNNPTTTIDNQEQNQQIEDRTLHLNQVFTDLNNNAITPQDDGLIYGYYPEVWELMPESRKELIVRSNELNQFEQELANARILNVKRSINEEQLQKKLSDVYTYNPQNDSAFRYLTSDDSLEKADIAEAFKLNVLDTENIQNESQQSIPDTAFFTPDSTIIDDYDNDTNVDEQLIVLNNLPLINDKIGVFNTWAHNISDKALNFYIDNTVNKDVKYLLNKEKNKRIYQHGTPNSTEQKYLDALILDPNAIVSVDEDGNTKIINGDNSVYEFNSNDFNSNIKLYNSLLLLNLGVDENIASDITDLLNGYTDPNDIKRASENLIMSYLAALDHFDLTDDSEQFLTEAFLKLSNISNKIQHNTYTDKYTAENDMSYLSLFGDIGRDMQIQLIESLPKNVNNSEFLGNIVMPANPDYSTYSLDALYLSNKYLNDDYTKLIFDDRLYNAVNAVGTTTYNIASPVLDVLGGKVVGEGAKLVVKKVADSGIAKLAKFTSKFVKENPNKAVQMLFSPEKLQIFKDGLANLALKRETSPITNIAFSMLDYNALQTISKKALNGANELFDLELSDNDVNVLSDIIAMSGTTAGSIKQYQVAKKLFNTLINKNTFNLVERALFDSVDKYTEVLANKYALYMSHPTMRVIARNVGYTLPDILSYKMNDKSFYDYLHNDLEFNTATAIAIQMITSAFSGGGLEGLVKASRTVPKSIALYAYSHSGGFDELDKTTGFWKYLSNTIRDLLTNENGTLNDFSKHISMNDDRILTKHGKLNFDYKVAVAKPNAQNLTHDISMDATELTFSDLLKLKIKNMAFRDACTSRDGIYKYDYTQISNKSERFAAMKQDDLYNTYFDKNGEMSLKLDKLIDKFMQDFNNKFVKSTQRAWNRFRRLIKTKKGLYSQTYLLNTTSPRSSQLAWENGLNEVNVPDMQYQNSEIGKFGKELGSFVFGGENEKTGRGLLQLAQDPVVRTFHKDRSFKGRFARGIFLGNDKVLTNDLQAVIQKSDGSEKIVPLFKNKKLNPEIKLTKDNHVEFGEMPFALKENEMMPLVYNSKGHWELPIINKNGERLILNMDFSGTGSGGLSDILNGNTKVLLAKKFLDKTPDELLIFFSISRDAHGNLLNRVYDPAMIRIGQNEVSNIALSNKYSIDELINSAKYFDRFQQFVTQYRETPNDGDLLMYNIIKNIK